MDALSSYAMCLLSALWLVGVGVAGSPNASLAPEGSSAAVRSPARDAVNSAWLLAWLICSPEERGRLPAASQFPAGPATFADVAAQCRVLGVPTRLRTLTYPELCSLDRPAIVLMRHGPQEVGHFAVVLGAGPGEATTINAGWLTIWVLNEDEFRLRWTGHALVPARGEPVASFTAAGCLFAGLAAGLLIPSAAAWRGRKTRCVRTNFARLQC